MTLTIQRKNQASVIATPCIKSRLITHKLHKPQNYEVIHQLITVVDKMLQSDQAHSFGIEKNFDRELIQTTTSSGCTTLSKKRNSVHSK